MNKPMDDKTRPEAWPDWKLERFLLGELPAETARELGSRAGTDPELAGRLAGLRAEHAALREAHPAGAMASGIERRLRQAGPAGSARPARGEGAGFPPASALAAVSARIRAAISAAAAAAGDILRPPKAAWAPALAMLLALAVLPFTRFSPFSTGSGTGVVNGADSLQAGGERLKGLKPRLILHRKQAQGSVQLHSGSAARAGDVIQIQYESAGRAQGALYSLDAEGRVTRHMPDRGGRSAALKAGGPVALDFAYELDDAAGWERFYFITSERPFDLAEVEEALRRAHPADPAGADSLPLRKDLGQSQFILLKEPGT